MEELEFKEGKILIIGDLILDEYILGSSSNLSYESPVPIVRREFTEYQLGGSGNVAKNIISLGGSCDLLTLVGKDPLEPIIMERIKESALDCDLILTLEDFLNSLKTRVFSSGKQVARIDSPIQPIKSRETFYNFIHDKVSLIGNYSLIIIQDSGRMFIDGEVLKPIFSEARSKGIRVIFDIPNYHKSNYDWEDIASVEILRTNLNFIKGISGIPLDVDLSKDELESLCLGFIKETGINSMIVTLGSGGLIYFDKSESKLVEGYKVYVFDSSGSGDSLLAALSLCISSGIDLENSLEISNISGHISCRYMGSTPVDLSELVEAYKILSPK